MDLFYRIVFNDLVDSKTGKRIIRNIPWYGLPVMQTMNFARIENTELRRATMLEF